MLNDSPLIFQVLPGKEINTTTLYQYTVGNTSEMAKMMKSKDGSKKAMQLANTLLSVMSASSETQLKRKDKIKVRREQENALLRCLESGFS